MNTLLLRLAGPMQSWGTQSRFLDRDTGLEPSKSGVIGLVCAALGRPREEPVDDLAVLRMGVRVDHEGVLRTDYQTAGGSYRRSAPPYGVVRADGTAGGTVVSHRHYLADATFLVGLAGDDLAMLERIDTALARPHWPLSLGRKAFVPGLPVRLPGGGVRPGIGLEDALMAEPWPEGDAEATDLRFVIEVAPRSAGEVRLDQPVGAAFAERRFLPRHVDTRLYPRPAHTGEPMEVPA